MKYYYCTCTGNGKQDENGRGEWNQVKVDSDDICLSCGYYAVVTNKEVKNRIELFSLLRLD